MPHDPLRLVVAGGGVAALELLAALQAAAPGRVAPLVLGAAPTFRDRPQELGAAFGLEAGEPRRLDELCAGLGATFRQDEVIAVDGAARRVRTARGATEAYDMLVLAVGAVAYAPFEDCATFDREHVPEDFDEVLDAAAEGFAEHLAIVVADGVTWTLPAYELALLTAAHRPTTQITVLTHEPRPLAAFGAVASAAVTDILAGAGVAVRTGVHPDVVTATALRAGGTWVHADRIVALPRLAGRRIAGVPADGRGMAPVDAWGRVAGLADVYAAGDGTSVPIAQGGLAAQQADAIAAHLVARLDRRPPPPPRPLVLRGILRTNAGPRYLRAELDDPERTSAISDQPLWWPATKVASRRLAAHLAALPPAARSAAAAAS